MSRRQPDIMIAGAPLECGLPASEPHWQAGIPTASLIRSECRGPAAGPQCLGLLPACQCRSGASAVGVGPPGLVIRVGINDRESNDTQST